MKKEEEEEQYQTRSRTFSSVVAGKGIPKRRPETMNFKLTDPQLLHCYICFEPLYSPIFQCKNGHICCSSCCTKAHNKCSICGLAIGDMRCRPLEKLLESIKVQCRNSMYGCKKTIDWNKINDHESSCVYEPCSCPLSDCSFVGSSAQVSWHFVEKHADSAKSFLYDSEFIMHLNTGDTYILQERTDKLLFLLSYTSELFGNVATVNRIGCSSARRKFYYEIKARDQECVLCLQSIVKEIQARVEVPPPSNGSLLIPNGFFQSSSPTTLELRIWPVREN